MAIGALVGAGGYYLLCKALDVKPDVGELVLCAAGGSVLGCLHDMLEPALHPGHRAFFHSIAVNGAAALALRRIWLSPPLSRKQKVLYVALGSACLSHPCMDALTPMGLPLI
jgi:membrane-bound metal-dependent hydrolase YbcI (DUF457 family)